MLKKYLKMLCTALKTRFCTSNITGSGEGEGWSDP